MASGRAILSSAALIIIVGALAYSAGLQQAAPSDNTTAQKAAASVPTRTQVPDDLVQYCFSPGGNCNQVLTSWIGKANGSIHVLIYSFTLTDVSQALIAAQKRGVDVKVVMERENVNESYSQFYVLRNAGVPIRWDTNSALMHDKFAVIDGHVILTGSFNWTVSASNSNNENLVVIDSASWGDAFESSFQQVWSAASS